MSDDSVLSELVGFLTPTTRLDVRRAALEYVVGVSGALDGSAGRLFTNNDYALGKALCSLCEATVADRSPTLAALTNFASGSAEAAQFILTNSGVTPIAYNACAFGAPFAGLAARLLSNLSRHFPDRVHDVLVKLDEKCLSTIIDVVEATPDDSDVSLLGYVVVNVSTMPAGRQTIVGTNILPKVYKLLVDGGDRRKEIAADICRNLAFEDSLHEILLPSDGTDAFLVALLQPLADEKDELDEDETQKLPLRLQYFEGSREKSTHIRQKLVESLYQLCATRHGRETLRKKGVYPLLRELDRATSAPPDPEAPPPKMRPPQLLAQEEHTLHALIGILIRYEDEMGISNNVGSLRHFE